MPVGHLAPHITRSSGKLIAANSADGVAIFTGYDLGPGDLRSGNVTIANTGTVAARLMLTETDASTDFAPGELMLAIDEITDGDPVIVFVGEFGGLSPGGIDLGEFEAGEERGFRFLAMLDLNSPTSQRDRGAGGAYEWGPVPAGAAPAACCATFHERQNCSKPPR